MNAARARLLALLDVLQGDELEILAEVGDGLAKGRKVYAGAALVRLRRGGR